MIRLKLVMWGVDSDDEPKGNQIKKKTAFCIAKARWLILSGASRGQMKSMTNFSAIVLANMTNPNTPGQMTTIGCSGQLPILAKLLAPMYKLPTTNTRLMTLKIMPNRILDTKISHKRSNEAGESWRGHVRSPIDPSQWRIFRMNVRRLYWSMMAKSVVRSFFNLTRTPRIPPTAGLGLKSLNDSWSTSFIILLRKLFYLQKWLGSMKPFKLELCPR